MCGTISPAILLKREIPIGDADEPVRVDGRDVAR
jgi:hypothetical protein